MHFQPEEHGKTSSHYGSEMKILFKTDVESIICRNDELSSTIDSELFILFVVNSQILLKNPVIAILLTFMYLVALYLSLIQQIIDSVSYFKNTVSLWSCQKQRKEKHIIMLTRGYLK